MGGTADVVEDAIKNPKAGLSGLAGAAGGFLLGGPIGGVLGFDVGFQAGGGEGGTLLGGALEGTGDIIGGSIGDELERWSKDYTQIVGVMSGDYHDRVKELSKMEDRIEQKEAEYNRGLDTLITKMESLVAFHEIFHMAMANRMDDYTQRYLPELKGVMAEYQRLLNKLKSDYDFVIGLTQGSFFEKVLGSLIMIAGGIASDLKAIVNGNAKSEDWKRVINVIITVIVVVFMWWNPVGWAAISAAVVGTVAALMTLDGMYANGAATGAIMSLLDFMFNDVLNLDDLVGSDFEKFDKDHEDYQEMVGWVRLSMMLYSLIASLGNGGDLLSGNGGTGAEGVDATMGASSASNGSAASSTSTTGTESYLGGAVEWGGSMETSSFLGVSFDTYSNIYSAYSKAKEINDTVAAHKQYEDLNKKLKADADKLNEAIMTKYRKNFMKHYKDTAYFLQDQQEYIDRYIWGMVAQNMYVDPYGTTPVANSRFSPDADTRMLAFGFEELFDEEKLAGSRGYFNSILYG